MPLHAEVIFYVAGGVYCDIYDKSVRCYFIQECVIPCGGEPHFPTVLRAWHVMTDPSEITSACGEALRRGEEDCQYEPVNTLYKYHRRLTH